MFVFSYLQCVLVGKLEEAEQENLLVYITQKPQGKISYVTIVLIFKVFHYILIMCNLIIQNGIAHISSVFSNLQITLLNSAFRKVCLHWFLDYG